MKNMLNMVINSPSHLSHVTPQAEKWWCALSFPYSTSVALGLILFAEQDGSFAEWFAGQVRERLFSRTLSPNLKKAPVNATARTTARFGLWTKECLVLLVPSSTEGAVRRANWLLAGFSEKQFPDGRQAIEVLSNWAHTHAVPNPQSIIIGIAIGVIPGVTLGRIRKKDALTCIIRNDLVETREPRLMHDVANATLDVLLRSLERAGGNMRKLEPEVTDWVFDDRVTLYYTAPLRTLMKIAHELDELDIVHAPVSDGRGLAVSPAVNSNAYEMFHWELSPLVF